jgi:hypothetical protein
MKSRCWYVGPEQTGTHLRTIYTGYLDMSRVPPEEQGITERSARPRFSRGGRATRTGQGSLTRHIRIIVKAPKPICGVNSSWPPAPTSALCTLDACNESEELNTCHWALFDTQSGRHCIKMFCQTCLNFCGRVGTVHNNLEPS